jgi:hypothetical protein
LETLTKCKDMYILRRDDKALSYNRMRELFIQAFQYFVPDIKKCGLNNELKCYKFNTL